MTLTCVLKNQLNSSPPMPRFGSSGAVHAPNHRYLFPSGQLSCFSCLLIPYNTTSATRNPRCTGYQQHTCYASENCTNCIKDTFINWIWQERKILKLLQPAMVARLSSLHYACHLPLPTAIIISHSPLLSPISPPTAPHFPWNKRAICSPTPNTATHTFSQPPVQDNVAVPCLLPVSFCTILHTCWPLPQVSVSSATSECQICRFWRVCTTHRPVLKNSTPFHIYSYWVCFQLQSNQLGDWLWHGGGH